MDFDGIIGKLADEACCDEELVRQFASLATSPVSTFAYVHDAHTVENTRTLLLHLFDQLDLNWQGHKLAFASINCVACFTQRLLIDTILNSLMKHRPESSNAYSLWRDGTLDSGAWNDSLDGLLHGLNACSVELSKSGETGISIPTKIILVFERTEKLKENIPGILAPLARLHEQAKLNITTIFLSESEWENISPCAGRFPDPYRITIGTPLKEDVVKMIVKNFPESESTTSCSPYNPALKTLFAYFVETVYDVCSPFTVEPKELAYLAAARWPGYVSPILEDWNHQPSVGFQGPSEDARIRLTKLFIPSLTSAVESLYPRISSAKEWIDANKPPSGFRLSESKAKLPQLPSASNSPADYLPELPRMSNFVLLASFLASHNPAKTDLRMFGRGIDEKKRRRKKGGSPRKQGGSAKVPQLLQGPIIFPYERLIAILGSLLLEYDEGLRNSPGFVATMIQFESDVYRIQTNALIQDLISKHLLRRITPPERIDASQFRCGLSHEQGLAIARRLNVPLADLMWDPI